MNVAYPTLWRRRLFLTEHHLLLLYPTVARGAHELACTWKFRILKVHHGTPRAFE